MLTGTLGIRLLLWTGKAVPMPPAADLLAAVKDVSVTNDADGDDGFQITVTLGKDRAFDYGLVRGGSLDPMTRVVVGVVMGAVPEVLIDGVVTHHQVGVSDEPGMSTLTVTGKGLTQMLDLEERNDKFENRPDSVIVSGLLLGDYARFGLAPQVTPTTDVPTQLERIPRQHETDLACIRRLAQRNGFVFYIEPVSVGVNRAYWGPETRLGIPQPALSINMGSATNVASIQFSNDALLPVATRGTIVDPISKLPIPVPPLPPLRVPPLASRRAPAHRTVLLRDTANANPATAATKAVAAATAAPEPVRGDGQVDGARYGNVLRARRLVGLRGAGMSYDGLYYVRRVTHTFARGSYRQGFSLSREGTGSLTPVVRP